MLRMFASKGLKWTQSHRIGLIGSDNETGLALREFIGHRKGLELEVLSETPDAASLAKSKLSLIVYDLDTSSESSLSAFDHFMAGRPPSLPVIVLSPSVDDEMVRWFLRLRVADWLKTPLSPGDLLAACLRLVEQSPTPNGGFRCVTMIGARGGVGATSLAIHAAFLLADAKRGGRPTCLVDLDLNQGACADYLDLKQNWQISELVPNPERLDAHLLEMMLSHHESGLAILSSQLPHHEPAPFEPEVITGVLDVASARFSNLVIDLPRYAAPWTENIVRGSTHVFVVTDFSIPGLKSAKRMVTDLDQLSDGTIKAKVIVNKFERSMFGSGLTNHEVRRILGDAHAGNIAADFRLAREAIDRGIPTMAIQAKNAIVTGMAKILDAALASSEVAANR